MSGRQGPFLAKSAVTIWLFVASSQVEPFGRCWLFVKLVFGPPHVGEIRGANCALNCQ